MEEILSSIRQIIADEEGGTRTAPDQRRDATPAGLPPRGSADDDDDVLELTDVVERPKAGPGRHENAAPPSVRFTSAPAAPDTGHKVDPGPRPDHAKRPDPAQKPDLAPNKESSPMAADLGKDLVSDHAASASLATMARLNRAANPAEGRPPAPRPGSPSIEQFMVELMTPMLKEWLDANLPTIVERVVESEVKKLARRAEML